MHNPIKIINHEAFIKGMKDYECGKAYAVQISSKDFVIPHRETPPVEGYIAPENFPHCCKSHSNMLKIALDKYNEFPNCCEAHKKLNTANWFNKKDFEYLPLKVVTTLSYTRYCIETFIDKSDWYKVITDYIDTVLKDYGQLPDGFGPPVGLELYIGNIQGNIQQSEKISDEQKTKLIEFIQNWGKTGEDVEPLDLNLLIGTYKTWLKDFPFEIPFFSHLKSYFEKQLPLIESKGETNVYTGMTSYKLTTYKSLLNFLGSITETIISEVNTLVLYEKGLITDIQRTNIDIINASHRFNLKHIKDKPTNGSSQYSKVIKNWFKYEKQYLHELTTALSKKQPVKNNSEKIQKRINTPLIALFCYISNEAELLKRENHETVLTFCKRVCKKYNLPFSDRVRQNYSTSYNKNNIEKVKELIFPLIDEKSRTTIIKYLDNKPPQKQKLYA